MLKNKNIVFIGLMGCGKTTIAKLLSQSLHQEMIDIDEYIEDKYHMTISQMFDVSEDFFRKKETICCQEIGQLQHCIISTGGGVVLNQQNIEYLKQNGIIIYIDRPTELIYQDIDISTRPLLKDGPQKLFDLYQQRHQKYLDACDYHIINNGTLEELVDKIKECIEK